MDISYKPLWKMLIDRDMSRSQLRIQAGISTRALAKLGKDEDVSTDVLRNICTVLQCDISDVMETCVIPNGERQEKKKDE